MGVGVGVIVGTGVGVTVGTGVGVGIGATVEKITNDDVVPGVKVVARATAGKLRPPL